MENILISEKNLKMTNRTTAHTNLCKEIMKEVPKHFPEIVCLEFDAGAARAMHNPDLIFHYGNKYYPDITFITWGAVWVGGEVKTGNAVMSPGQKKFAHRVGDISAQVFELRSVEDAIEMLKGYKRKWRENLR